MRQDNTDKLMN